MLKEHEYFISSNKVSNLHYIIWAPDNKAPKSVLHIIHGMSEHIERYDNFAKYLVNQGFAVVGHDLLGHGISVSSQKDLGFFAKKNGNLYNIQDIKYVHDICEKKFPGLSYFMLGHSMGSFLLRQFLHTYPDTNINGAIIMGTANGSYNLVKFVKILSSFLCKLRGKRYRSRLLFNLTLGHNNKAFEMENSYYAWLSSDKNTQKKYEQDELSGFSFTVSAYRDMFEGISTLYEPKNLQKMNRHLSILLISGSMDPVGGYGKGVEDIYDKYKSLGFTDLKIKLYTGMRHEILNEKNKQLVYDYIYKWMTNRIRSL